MTDWCDEGDHDWAPWVQMRMCHHCGEQEVIELDPNYGGPFAPMGCGEAPEPADRDGDVGSGVMPQSGGLHIGRRRA